MGSLFVAPVYASVPNDYGNVTIQRTPNDTVGNYSNWCTTFIYQGKTYNLETNYDSNGIPYVVATTTSDVNLNYFRWNHSDDCINKPSVYQSSPLSSFMPDSTSGYNFYIITNEYEPFSTYPSYVKTYTSSYLDITWYTTNGNNLGGHDDYQQKNKTATTTTKQISYNGQRYSITKVEGWALATSTNSIPNYSTNNSGVLGEMDFEDGQWDSDSTRLYATVYTNVDLYNEIQTSQDMYTYLQNINFYANANIETSSSTQYLNNDCPTCTRIISSSPSHNQLLSSVDSNDFEYAVDFYLSEEDYNSAYIWNVSYPSITIRIANSSGFVESYTGQIMNFGNNSWSQKFTSVSATGTYQVTIDINKHYQFNDTVFSSVFPFSDSNILNDVRVFYVGTTTRSSAAGTYYVTTPSGGVIYSAYSGIQCDISLAGFLSAESWTCIMEYVVATLIPSNESAKTYLMNAVSDLSLIPPWGYLTYANLLLLNPTTTPMANIPISFPESSPLHGATLDLSISSALDSSNAFIDETRVDTINGSPMDEFLKYWNTIWYLMFGLWLMSEIFASFGSTPFKTSFENYKQYQNKQEYKNNKK